MNTQQQLSSATKSPRDTNLELFRIFAMLAIVAHHYVANSGLMQTPDVIQNPFSMKSLFYILLGAWGKTGINCFVFITGYYMCKSSITLKKFLKLLLEVMFYKVSIYFIFLLSGYEPFSVKNCLQSVSPIYKIDKNFVSCYIIFFLLIPFLNILVKNMNEKIHRNLLYLLLFVFTILGSVPHFHITFNYVTWFCVIYIIASYIRLYPKDIFSSTKFWGIVFSASLLLAITSILGLSYIGEHTNKFIPYFFVSDSNKIFAIMLGVSSFMLFKNLKIKYSPFINTVAATTFGILLIHANSDTMRTWLWKDICKNVYVFNLDIFWLYAILTILAVFAICSFIDYLRIKFVETPIFNLLYKKDIISK